jgi:hypothetical protein
MKLLKKLPAKLKETTSLMTPLSLLSSLLTRTTIRNLPSQNTGLITVT